MKAGAVAYDISCAACHGRDGKGSALFPLLAGNQSPSSAPIRCGWCWRAARRGDTKGAHRTRHAKPGLAPEQ
jgi:mono/diheme cytochrome c family protein